MASNVAILASYIGQPATVPMNQGKVYVDVKILDMRTNYGRTQVRITPSAGSGETWVASERVFMDPSGQHPSDVEAFDAHYGE